MLKLNISGYKDGSFRTASIFRYFSYYNLDPNDTRCSSTVSTERLTRIELQSYVQNSKYVTFFKPIFCHKKVLTQLRKLMASTAELKFHLEVQCKSFKIFLLKLSGFTFSLILVSKRGQKSSQMNTEVR
jgi:hypothetical protein